ncbi:MAG: glycoside hydrolase family 16 protein [Jatrophihabitans sp.]
MMSARRLVVLAVSTLALIATGLPAQASAWWEPPPLPARGPATCAGPQLVKADGQPWTCTFDDEFDGSSLDGKNWVPLTTAATGAAGPACFADSPNNISVSGGTLNLTARKEAAPFTCQSQNTTFSTQYTAGEVASTNRFAQTYGRFAIRAKFPAATVAGLHSALWLWPQNALYNGLFGELDIAEVYSVYNDRAVPYMHYWYDPSTINLQTHVNNVTNNYCLIDDVTAFHEYTVEWTPTTMTILYDGHTCVTNNLLPYGTSPFDQPYFIALTQTLENGGYNGFDPLRTPLPAMTRIDWVRVWK